MGDLFWNKIAGAVLAIFLVVIGLRTFGEGLFEHEQTDELAYPVDLSAFESAGAGGEEQETGPLDFGALLASASISAGEQVARRCASCHTFDRGMADGTGPHMWDVVGREVAHVAGFNYSTAMVEYSQGGTTWTYQNLYDYLASPRQYIPGTAMSFAGLRDSEDRIDIIAYLYSLSDNPVPFPDPLPVEADAAPVEADAAPAADGEGAVETATEEPEAAAEAGTADAAGEGEAPAMDEEPTETEG